MTPLLPPSIPDVLRGWCARRPELAEAMIAAYHEGVREVARRREALGRPQRAPMWEEQLEARLEREAIQAEELPPGGPHG